MRRCFAILLIGVTGCTNAPLAGFLNLVAPSRIGRTDAPLPPDLPPAPPPAGQLLPPNPPPIATPTSNPRTGDHEFTPPLPPLDGRP